MSKNLFQTRRWQQSTSSVYNIPHFYLLQCSRRFGDYVLYKSTFYLNIPWCICQRHHYMCTKITEMIVSAKVALFRQHWPLSRQIPTGTEIEVNVTIQLTVPWSNVYHSFIHSCSSWHYTHNPHVWNETRRHAHVTAAVGSCYRCWNRCDDSRGLHLDIAADRPGSRNFPDDEAAPFPLPPWRHPTNPDSAVETPDYHLSA